MQINAVQVALSNTSKWSNAGLSYSFPVGSAWRDYEHVFKAEQDLPASDSRLQFWFTSTGTLWLADVTLGTRSPNSVMSIIPRSARRE